METSPWKGLGGEVPPSPRLCRDQLPPVEPGLYGSWVPFHFSHVAY